MFHVILVFSCISNTCTMNACMNKFTYECYSMLCVLSLIYARYKIFSFAYLFAILQFIENCDILSSFFSVKWTKIILICSVNFKNPYIEINCRFHEPCKWCIHPWFSKTVVIFLFVNLLGPLFLFLDNLLLESWFFSRSLGFEALQ